MALLKKQSIKLYMELREFLQSSQELREFLHFACSFMSPFNGTQHYSPPPRAARGLKLPVCILHEKQQQQQQSAA